MGLSVCHVGRVITSTPTRGSVPCVRVPWQLLETGEDHTAANVAAFTDWPFISDDGRGLAVEQYLTTDTPS